jgi:flagellar basal-body rod protein FlgG
MAITALNSAASGLKALSTRIDVVANNLANAETTAFKRSRVNFEDLMYLTLKQPGTQTQSGEIAPAGIFVGLGVRISNTQLDLEQGSLERTDRPLDVGIEGQGFFKVRVMDTVGDGTAYTRNGNFFVNNDGELVLGMGDGYKIIPRSASRPTRRTSASARTATSPSSAPASRTRPTSVSCASRPSSTRRASNSSAAACTRRRTRRATRSKAIRARTAQGTILQGYLEASNVDPVKELVTLIKTQRAFELNSQSIQTADQALQTVGNLRRM